MANLVWLFALLCVQFSRGAFGVPAVTDSELTVDPETWKQDETLIEEIRDVVDVKDKADDKIDDKDEFWTEEDQKWLDEIMGKDSDEDYDVDYEELGKLMADIEALMEKHHPEKANYEWLQELAKWFLDGEYDEDDGSEESSEELSWPNKERSRKEKSPMQKRFWSV